MSNGQSDGPALAGSHHRRQTRPALTGLVLIAFLLGASLPARGSLEAYDAAILADRTAGLIPLTKLTTAVTFFDTNKVAFNFGNNSGNVTMEFIVEGDPAAGGPSGILAMGVNPNSSLRYEQFNDTGQLGFTQSGVEDYVFSPLVPSPTIPVHLAFLWNAATRTMQLYLNGSFAGDRKSVSAAFTMPSGLGWLGNNAAGTEGMVGTLHRVTVYDDLIPDDALMRHADAFNDFKRPPILVGFTATPPAIFAPAASQLTWDVRGADRIFIDDADVTALPSLAVAPAATTTYALVATNLGGSVTGRVTLAVNPGPVISRFASSKSFAGPGETVTLSWQARYAQDFLLSPGIGDVTVETLNGSGSTNLVIQASTTFTLTASSAFGSATTQAIVRVVAPADHLVISEFSADNQAAIADEDGNHPDWIEIHNPTSRDLSLAGYSLTDDPNDPAKWLFPDLILRPGGYLIVFASGKNRVNPASPLHTDFQLSKAGGYLALVAPGAVVVHAFAPYPPQLADVSYGLLGGDPTLVRAMGVPTPGTANNETEAPPAPVRFSRASGTFTNAFQLALATDTPGAIIRFTTDQSVPSETHGDLYTGPIPINGSSHVRAIALGAGQASRVTGEAYLKLAQDLQGYTSTLPIMVIDNFGAGVIPQKGWSGNGSGVKQRPRQPAVWATFDRANGVSSLAAAPQMISPMGIRGRGAFSSTWRQKPYSVDAVDEQGDNLDVSPLGLPADAEWILYFPDPDNEKDPTLLMNTFAYELSRNTGRYSVRFRWVEAFINEDGGDLKLADRRGVYAIIEKVSRGPNRLDFQKLSEDGAQGGFLLGINRMDAEPEGGWPAPNGATAPQFFHTAGPNRIPESQPNSLVGGDDEPQQGNGFLNFDTPGGYTINTAQRAAIESWFKKFEDVLWNNAIWRDPVNGYRKHLDPLDFADYFILNVLTRNGDGMLISMFPWVGDDGKLRMGPAWDYNWAAYYVSGTDPTGSLLHRSEQLWYERLFVDVDFMQLYIDRWWQLRRGPMSNEAMAAIIDRQSAEISAPKALLNGMPNAADWTARLGLMKSWLQTRANWIDSNYLRPPSFNQDGGDVADGFQFTLLGTNGTIYFTTDGSDPRTLGGGVAASAQAFQLPVTITAQTLVQSRIRNGTNWSGLTTALFSPPQDLSGLELTEIHYNPTPFGIHSGDDLEFVELKNTGSTPLRLGAFSFTAGITFAFTNGTVLQPGQFFVLARNAAAFQARHPGLTPNGIYSGRLDNGGETLQISTASGSAVLAVTYGDRAPWPITPDGHGFSLVPRDRGTTPNSDRGANWRASSLPGGSPGADDPETAVSPVLINEVLSHSNPPEVDWIELFNPGSTGVEVGGWYLSDDGSAPQKFRIPDGTLVPAGGFLVVTETNFNPAPGSPLSFALGSAGDSIYLSSGNASSNLTGYSHGFSFGASAAAVSFGRYVNSIGEEQFPAQLALTPEATNSGPRVGPVVIQEIHYHPDTGSDEFVELRNVTTDAVPLYDLERPTNTWRVAGLGFVFPTNVVLPAEGVLLITPLDPAAFRAKYNVPATVAIFGPYSGQLQDSGERLELQRPDLPDTNGVPYVAIDSVRYNDKFPWPPAADGSGPSLQRRTPGAYGDDPINWQAAVPTPGVNFTAGQAPAIVVQPRNVLAMEQDTATFSVAADGAGPIFHQWLFSGTPLAGATNATLTLTNVQLAQAGGYSAVVFNAFGSAASASAQLTVLRRPTVLTQPVSQFIKTGSTAQFSVLAVGNGLIRYQWRLNGTNLPDATNATLSVTNAQLANVGIYTAEIRDNTATTLSQPASLTLLFDPVIIQSPVSQIVVTGGTVTLSVRVATNATLPIGYRWRRNGASVPDGTFVLNDYSSFITLTNLQGQFFNYSVVVTNRSKPAGNLSATAVLTFALDANRDGIPDSWATDNNAVDGNADPDADGLSSSQEFFAGTDPHDPASVPKLFPPQAGPAGRTLEFNASSNRTYTIEWMESLDAGRWTKLADIPAQSSNHLERVIDPLPGADGRVYRLLVPRRADGAPQPTLLRSPRSRVLEPGDDTELSVYAIGSGPLTHQWWFNGSPLPGATHSNLLLQDLQFSNVGTYTVVVSDLAGAITNQPPAIVALRPQILTQPASHTVAAGEPVSFSVAATGTGALRYRWSHNGKWLAGETGPSLSLPGVTPADAGNYQVTISHETPLGRISVASDIAVLTVR